MPQDKITPISAEVQWTSTLNPCLLAESKFKLIVKTVKESERKYSPQQLREIQSSSGLVCFSGLQPDTAYHALVVIACSEMSSTCTKEPAPFQTKGN